MSNQVIRAIEKHIVEVLCQQSVKEELSYYLENNVFLDEEGEEVEFSVDEFDWSITLDLKSVASV